MGNSKSKNESNVVNDNEVYSDESDSDAEQNSQLPGNNCTPSSLDTLAESIDHRKYIYPFENLVFEGGGTKGISYGGALMELDEMGLLRQVKRFAGSSIGSLTAGLLAVGYSGREIGDLMSVSLESQILDHSCGYLSLLPNLLSQFGWNPGNGILRWFKQCMYEATQNSDITFREVYEKFGTELCVVITNITQMTVKYCHVKTTPDLPVALAVRMSTAIPGLMAAQKYAFSGQTDIYVDGGLLCNYPIHCFDGWWLSLDPKDSFLKQLQPLSKLNEICENSNRFGEWNEKTLGFVLYSDDEPEMYRHKLEARRGAELLPFPKSKLARKFQKASKDKKVELMRTKYVLKAVDVFLKVLSDHDVDESSTISVKELEAVFKDPSFKRSYRRRLFGENMTSNEAFCMIRDGVDIRKPLPGKRMQSKKSVATEMTPLKDAICSSVSEEEDIRYNDLVVFLEKNGVNVMSRLVGYERSEVNDFTGFLSLVTDCMVANLKRVFLKDRDIDRTVGINTAFLHTTDFSFEKEDFDYVTEQGRRSLVSFLKYYVAKNNPPMKSGESESTLSVSTCT